MTICLSSKQFPAGQEGRTEMSLDVLGRPRAYLFHAVGAQLMFINRDGFVILRGFRDTRKTSFLYVSFVGFQNEFNKLVFKRALNAFWGVHCLPYFRPVLVIFLACMCAYMLVCTYVHMCMYVCGSAQEPEKACGVVCCGSNHSLSHLF